MVTTRKIITTVDLMGYKIKVYENINTDNARRFGPNHEITVGLRAAIHGQPGNLRVTPESIEACLNVMPFVSAFEITDSMGNGALAAFNVPTSA